MTVIKKIFVISGLTMLVLASFNHLITFAESSTQITINNDLYNPPSQLKPHSISVCINGNLEKTITEVGKTKWETSPGDKYVRIFVNQIGSVSCVEGSGKQFEVFEDHTTLENGTNTTWDLSGEPIIRGVKLHQSMKVLNTTSNPGGNSMLVFSPTEGSVFDKVCIDGVISPQARFREYFVSEGKHAVSLATPHGDCDPGFHLKLEIHPTTTTKIEVINSLDYNEACIKGVEVYDDVEHISPAVKHDVPTVIPAKVQDVATKLTSAQAVTKALPRTGGTENMVFVSSGLVVLGFAGYKNFKRKSIKIDV
jgi:LPXTG-motif cell wall-anchored protein